MLSFSRRNVKRRRHAHSHVKTIRGKTRRCFFQPPSFITSGSKIEIDPSPDEAFCSAFSFPLFRESMGFSRVGNGNRRFVLCLFFLFAIGAERRMDTMIDRLARAIDSPFQCPCANRGNHYCARKENSSPLSVTPCLRRRVFYFEFHNLLVPPSFSPRLQCRFGSWRSGSLLCNCKVCDGVGVEWRAFHMEVLDVTSRSR